LISDTDDGWEDEDWDEDDIGFEEVNVKVDEDGAEEVLKLKKTKTERNINDDINYNLIE